MNQKKKNQTQAKKLNRVKSEEMMPIGSLMQEIGQLKEELKSIKLAKRQEPPPKSIITEPKENKENKQARDIEFVEIQCTSREIKLKTQIQLNKLRRSIMVQDDNKTIRTINDIFEIFNIQLKEITSERNRYKLEIEEMIFIYESYKKQEEEKYRIVMRNNQKLQQEIEILKKEVMKIVEEEQVKEEERRVIEQQMKENEEKLNRQNEELMKNNAELEGLIEQWELQCRALKEKCLSYQKSLENKSEEMIFMQEDIKYLRLESEKFKSQKKEIEKLWEKSTAESKQYKRAAQEQMDKLQREKNKWMNECSLRRQQSEQIQAIQSHKTMLFKEIQELRNNFTLKSKELAENKSLLHETQIKMISLESQNFKMAQENEKAKRQTEIWERNIQGLRNEVEELQSLQTHTSQSIRAKSVMASIDQSQKKVREEKLKALEDIHNLIKQHKNEIDENE